MDKTIDFKAGLRPRIAPSALKEPSTGRDVLHAPIRSSRIQAEATAEHPAMKAALEQAIKSITGASLVGARDEKPEDRLQEKIHEEGQPPRTVPDFSAFRIACDSAAAKDAVVRALRNRFAVVREKDEFDCGAEDSGFHAHIMQVRLPDSSVSHEVQVLPKEQATIAESQHGLYEKARNGNDAASAQLKAKNHEAMERFNARNEVGQKQTLNTKGAGESPEPGKGGSVSAAPKSGTKIEKGSRVKLPNGTTGTVAWTMGGKARVKAEDGSRHDVAHKDLQAHEDEPEDVKGVTVGTPGHDRPAKGAIAVDLDLTLAEYDGFKGATVIGKPIASEVARVKQLLADGKDVWLYTARAAHPEAIPAIQAWTKQNLGEVLPITNLKYPAFEVFIDDRAEKPVRMQPAAFHAGLRPRGPLTSAQA